jgi:sulfatase modifying factor 1
MRGYIAAMSFFLAGAVLTVGCQNQPAPPGGQAATRPADAAASTADGPAAPWPFDAAEAARRQQAAATAAGVPVETELTLAESVSLKLRLIPAGRFMMGSPETEEGHDPDDEVLHEVVLTRPYYIGACEVTRSQFAAFIKATEYKTDAEDSGPSMVTSSTFVYPRLVSSWREQPDGLTWTDAYPVICMSYNDGASFCKWLARKTGKTVRLPTRAEWEYACRAGSAGPYCFGNDVAQLCEYANYADKLAVPHWKDEAHSDGFALVAPVASFQPNAWGLYDMHGNANEWVAHWKDRHPDPQKQAARQVDPTGPADGGMRVFMGGCWTSADTNCRSANAEGAGSPWGAWDGCGFRVVVELPPKD